MTRSVEAASLAPLERGIKRASFLFSLLVLAQREIGVEHPTIELRDSSSISWTEGNLEVSPRGRGKRDNQGKEIIPLKKWASYGVLGMNFPARRRAD